MKKIYRSTLSLIKKLVNPNHKLVDEDKIKELMNFFHADEYGHEASSNQADLGYGWMHYSIIRLIKPKRILCVGSRHGYIPAILAQACKDNGLGHVDFVDAGYGEDDANGWTGVGFWKTVAGKNIFDNFDLENHITLFVQTTANFVKKYSKYKYQYIYIDANHSYEGVLLDYKKLWPMLAHNGFMSFHDISVKENKPEGKYGVWKLWKELEKKHSTIDFPFLGSGLGILQKKDESLKKLKK